MSVWKPLKSQRGENRGDNPIVSDSGTISVGRNRAGEDVRVFVRINKN